MVASDVILQGHALRVSDEISNSACAEIVFHRKTLPITKHPLLIAKVSLILSIHRPFNLFNRIPIIPDHMYPINKVNPIPVCISDHIFPWIQWIQFRYTSRIILFVPRIQVIGIDIPDKITPGIQLNSMPGGRAICTRSKINC